MAERFVAYHQPIPLPLTYSIVPKLERENQKFLHLGFLVGVTFHILLFLLNPTWRTQTRTIQAIPINLITARHIPSALLPAHNQIVKPFSYRISFTKGIPSGAFKTKNLSVFPMRIDEPGITFDFDPTAVQSDFSGIFDRIEWEFDQKYETVPLKNEVFMDDGVIKGMVVIPPNDRKAIQGYMYIAAATGESFAWKDTLENAAKDIAYALNRFTNIKAMHEYRPMTATRGETFHRNPVLFITASRLCMLSTGELDYLKRYMYSDGFLIIDNDMSCQAPHHTRRMITETFREMFSHETWRTAKLQPRHPVFHSFFDVETVPPGDIDTSDQSSVWGLFLDQSLDLNAVFLEPGYAGLWKDDKKNRSQIELATNIVVYGLARYEEIRDEFKRTQYVSDYAVREW